MLNGNNVVILNGNVGKEPDVKVMGAKGTKVAKFSVATRGIRKDDPPEWHRVTCFNAQAEFVEKHVKKGSSVVIIGTIKTDTWEKDGAKQYMTGIIAESVQFGNVGSGGKKSDAEETATVAADADDDLPF